MGKRRVSPRRLQENETNKLVTSNFDALLATVRFPWNSHTISAQVRLEWRVAKAVKGSSGQGCLG